MERQNIIAQCAMKNFSEIQMEKYDWRLVLIE